MSGRGGMCHNPFGGRMRLDRLDFTEMMGAKDEPEKILFLQTITDAIHNYLFFGLGKNGTTADEFAYACEYLFVVRAKDKSTWHGRRTVHAQVQRGGRRTVLRKQMTDGEFEACCFDTHYEYSGLSLFMEIDRFLAWLVREREAILKDNQDQVREYLDNVFHNACLKAKPGHQLPLPLRDRVQELARARRMEDVAQIIYLPPKYYQAPV